MKACTGTLYFGDNRVITMPVWVSQAHRAGRIALRFRVGAVLGRDRDGPRVD
jgi:hypothetical protein